MSHIRDEYIKRFKGKRIQGDGFDAESLWNNVSASLQNESKAKSNKKKLIVVTLLTFLFGVSSLFYFFPSEDISDNRLAVETNESTLEGYSVNSLENLENVSLAKEICPTELVESKQSIANIDLNKEKVEKEVSARISKSQNSNQTTISLVRESVPEDFFSATNAISNIPPENSSNTLESIDKKSPKISDLTLLSLQQNLLSTENLLLPQLPTVALFFTGQEKKVKTKNHFVAGIYGGINKMNSAYKASELPNLEDLKNESENGQLGTSIGIETSLVLRNKWLINSGLEQNTFWSKFEYEGQIDDYGLFKENQLLRVKIDALTRDTIERIVGDTTLIVNATRNVIHFNKFKTWSIPLEFGVQMQKQKWTLGIAGGTVFNFTTAQEGKHLNDDAAISTFTKDDETVPFKSFDLGLRISPTVGYELTNSLSIIFQPKWTWRSNSNSDKIRSNTQILNLNLGIRHTFR